MASPLLHHHVVLIGGGHAHVQVMTALAMTRVPGLRLTLVTDRRFTPYSGMLPGCIAGRYTPEAIHIDLARLAHHTGAHLVMAPAAGLDPAHGHVLFADRAPLAYDTLSIDVGIKPDLSGIEGGEQHALPVKPISSLLERLAVLDSTVLRAVAQPRLTVVGGGAAGVELALALRARFASGTAPRPSVTLLSSSPLVTTLNDGVRRHVEAALARHGIQWRTDFRVARVTPDGVVSADGRVEPAHAVLVATAARAPQWLAESGLPTAADGSVLIRSTLQVAGQDQIFAVGDCAADPLHPREKAGVFAVRQGPILADNLLRILRGRPLRHHRPQRDFLTLLATGDGRAIAGRGRWFALEGAWVWRWKDRIDRRFVERFQRFGADTADAAISRPATPG